MVQKTRGRADKHLNAVLDVLATKYKAEHPRCRIDAFRRGPYAIWVRVIDADFEGMTRGQRHHRIWKVLDDLPIETLAQMSVVLPLTPKERKTSMVSLDFDERVGMKRRTKAEPGSV